MPQILFWDIKIKPVTLLVTIVDHRLVNITHRWALLMGGAHKPTGLTDQTKKDNIPPVEEKRNN